MLPLSSQSSEESRFADHDGGISNNSLHFRPASSLGIASQLKGLLIAESNQSELSLHPGSSLEGSKSDQSSQSSQSGSSTCIEDLLLVDSRPTQVQDEESILSPMVVSKPSGPLAAAPSISTSSEVGGASPTAGTNGNAIEMDTAKSLANFESGENGNLRLQIPNNSASSSYASHIKPKLRSYQSSPSIRLYAEKSSSWESSSTSTCKKSKSAKRVSFDPQTLMADASRTGDLALYKSMLAILQEEGTSGTLKEIINYQSASRQLSSLHLAASYNHLELCKFLVEMGANVNLTDVEGWTPMHCAAAEGHLKVLEFLVKGPDADLQAATFEGEMIEDVVEDEEQRQKVIDILEAQSR
ncbi:MAG: ankyrin repeat-containing domain protein [Benniella sp.]|nr:MAG: ankyrin repeat-containing domain protein [Benniella sp.]